jgi:hypothetical protein
MKHPKDDIPVRTPIWDSLQMLFMDTDADGFLESMTEVCARSPYSIEEIEQILFNEVLPACRLNLFLLPAPEWAGFETGWLVDRVLTKHRFGRRRPIILRRYTAGWWQRLRPMIERRRRDAAPR